MLRDPATSPCFVQGCALGKMPPEVQQFMRQPELIRVTKATPLDGAPAGPSGYHRGQAYDDKGKVIGERLIVGLFTSVAYNQSPSDIPLLRRKVVGRHRALRLRPSSHSTARR